MYPFTSCSRYFYVYAICSYAVIFNDVCHLEICQHDTSLGKWEAVHSTLSSYSVDIAKSFSPSSLWSFVCFLGSPTHDRDGSAFLSLRHYHVSSMQSGTPELSRIMRIHAGQKSGNIPYPTPNLHICFCTFICSSLSPKCPPFQC